MVEERADKILQKAKWLKEVTTAAGVVPGMESDQDMVAICYPVPSFSGAVISYSPAPHL
jgi:hypothetical protein